MNWDTILNYVNGDCSHAEARQVIDWASEQTENRYLLTYLERRRAQLKQPLKQGDIDEQWLSLLSKIFENPQLNNKRLNSKLYWLSGVAASLLLFCFLGSLYIQKVNNQVQHKIQTLQSAQNTGGHLTLPDGTQVFMAPNSQLRYTNSFNTNNREVQLTGEAFFSVKHDAHKPFIIRTVNHLAVTVLGTSFNVYARPKVNIEVKVATGLVGITINNKTNLVKAGQQLIFKSINQEIIVKDVNTHDATSLQNQILFFNDNNADEIAEKLQRWYNISIEVAPSARKYPRFSGEMKDTGINNLLPGLSYATGLRYKFKNPHTVIIF